MTKLVWLEPPVCERIPPVITVTHDTTGDGGHPRLMSAAIGISVTRNLRRLWLASSANAITAIRNSRRLRLQHLSLSLPPSTTFFADHSCAHLDIIHHNYLALFVTRSCRGFGPLCDRGFPPLGPCPWSALLVRGVGGCTQAAARCLNLVAAQSPRGLLKAALCRCPNSPQPPQPKLRTRCPKSVKEGGGDTSFLSSRNTSLLIGYVGIETQDLICKLREAVMKETQNKDGHAQERNEWKWEVLIEVQINYCKSNRMWIRSNNPQISCNWLSIEKVRSSPCL